MWLPPIVVASAAVAAAGNLAAATVHELDGLGLEEAVGRSNGEAVVVPAEVATLPVEGDARGQRGRGSDVFCGRGHGGVLLNGRYGDRDLVHRRRTPDFAVVALPSPRVRFEDAVRAAAGVVDLVILVGGLQFSIE